MADRFPWFPMYAADWLTSPAVLAMTLEQQGAYMRLLCIAWNAGRDEPSVTADPRELGRVLGLPAAKWAKIGPAIVACFEQRNGRLFNRKLTEVWEIQRAKYEIASRAGKASAEQRAFNRRSTGVAIPLQRKPNHTDAESDRTKSSSGPTRLGAVTDSALASANRGRA